MEQIMESANDNGLEAGRIPSMLYVHLLTHDSLLV